MSNFQKSIIFSAIFLALFQILRLSFFFMFFGDTEFDILPFLNGIRFDLFVLSWLWGLFLVVLNLPLIDRIRYFELISQILFIIMYISLVFIILLCVADIIYFGYSGKHISFEILTVFEDLDFIVNFTFKKYLFHLVAFVVFSLALLYVWIKISKIKLKRLSLNYQIISFLFLISVLGFGLRGTFSSKPIHIVDAFENGLKSGNISLNGAFTIFTTLFSARNNLKSSDFYFFESNEEAKEILGIPKDKLYPFEQKITCSGMQRKLNVVIFILESWNPKFVDGISHNSYKVTPNFDSILEKSIVFENFFSAGLRSIVGLQAIFTGIPFLPGLPTVCFGLDGVNFSGIGTILGKEGYKTLFVQSSRKRSYRLDSLAKASGFEYVFGKEDIMKEVGILLKYPDPDFPTFGWDYETLVFFEKKINELGEPFLAVVFTGTTHPLFPKLPKEFMIYPYSPKGIGGYLNTLFYSDWSIGKFFSLARERDWFKRTIFIFVSDHSYGEDDFEKKFKIVFAIYAPDIFSPKRITDIAGSQYDIIPTILDILCLNSDFSSIGKSLFRKTSEDFAFVSDGDIAGAITTQGFVTNIDKDSSWIKLKLLALLQLSFYALRTNRWFKRF